MSTKTAASTDKPAAKAAIGGTVAHHLGTAVFAYQQWAVRLPLNRVLDAYLHVARDETNQPGRTLALRRAQCFSGGLTALRLPCLEALR